VNRYRFGSAVVVSDLPLPGLLVAGEAETETETVIAVRLSCKGTGRRAPRPPVSDDAGVGSALRTQRWRSPQGAHRLRFEYGNEFAEVTIDQGGADIEVECSAAAEAELPALLQGGVLGAALRLRGVTALHANAIAAGGRAVLVAGASGAGKSSLSWALVQHGGRLIGDDLAAIEARPGGFQVHGGRMGLRIWPDAAERLMVPETNLSALFPIVEQLEKKVLFDSSRLEQSPVPLHAVYLLGTRDAGLEAPLIQEISPSARLAALAANIYGSLDPGREIRRRELKLLAEVAARVPVRRLIMPNALDRLPTMAASLRHLLFE
jgi:hypothetical protein